ncbi:sugar ABC transporter ATP-binding protein [Actinoalloteichus hymeniacidonis]|uniref:ABC-type sugar transport system, ATPase component n=1 Tax=Actinoalloteichus hymeniacidonis TaxID=340345 RepID=A0AAC9HVY4_9PSEU|nr:sugar ABC transporter ATP-binding protein [Actinoalloteichus hymeniacidonis]AOS65480.1 ABC-type sugar transport system, ATPase component [Actinoalloteichus hymeniacidonis]MBB5906433.1 rhamnose transport system ATP-binding protein [Actinoalloteichus hymeniacidonis]
MAEPDDVAVGPPPPLSLRGVGKSYGAVTALDGVELDLLAGEVHALMGENGAGKSTLVKMLAGVHEPDSGELLLDGVAHPLTGTAEARATGIAVIYQEPTLFPDLSVAENIFMGRQPTTRFGRIDHRAMRAACAALFDRLGVRLDPDRPARGLSIADQQMVEIAKALSFDVRVLVMDEPTSALSGVEVERLFGVVRALRDAGAAVLFISHRFDEVFDLCDRITVLRDGRWVSCDAIGDLTVDTVIRRMVGREVSSLFPKTEAPLREIALEVEGLSRAGVFHDVDFHVRGGEIVALAGLVGAGRSEVVRAVFGIDRYDSGSVRVAGKPLRPGNPAAAMAAGIALVPEDRRQQGLVMELSVQRNATLTRLWNLARFGWLSGRSEREHATEWSRRLQVKAEHITDAVSTLSGGNQQKVVLAKWLATDPAVLIVDEPTRGIDVGTKSEVHRLLSELAGEGMAVIMVSSELPEVLGMADRVLVMHEGRLVADIPRARADENSVMAAATGGQDRR